MDRSWPVPKSQCPKCGHSMDRAESPATGARPSPGDITLCIRCAAVLHFTTDMEMRLLPNLDLLDQEQRKEIEELRGRILKTRRLAPDEH